MKFLDIAFYSSVSIVTAIAATELGLNPFAQPATVATQNTAQQIVITPYANAQPATDTAVESTVEPVKTQNTAQPATDTAVESTVESAVEPVTETRDFWAEAEATGSEDLAKLKSWFTDKKEAIATDYANYEAPWEREEDPAKVAAREEEIRQYNADIQAREDADTAASKEQRRQKILATGSATYHFESADNYIARYNYHINNSGVRYGHLLGNLYRAVNCANAIGDTAKAEYYQSVLDAHKAATGKTVRPNFRNYCSASNYL